MYNKPSESATDLIAHDLTSPAPAQVALSRQGEPPMTAEPPSTTTASTRGTFFERAHDKQYYHLPSFYSNLSQESPTKSNPKPGRWNQAFQGWRIAFLSWFNVLLLLLPISYFITMSPKNTHGLAFALCIIALIPLVRLHELSTKQLILRIGGSRTGLLNASMSNFVEIVVAISALRKCELRVVQSSLIGSMLSKLLLVMGLCFFAGGVRFSEQGFDSTATQIHSSLLSLSVGAVLLPAAYHFALSSESTEMQQQGILRMSHGVSVVLLLIYIAYLVFQLWSHSHLYEDQRNNKKSNRLTTVIKEQNINRKERARLASSMSRSDSQGDKALYDNCFSLDPPRRPFASSPCSSSTDLAQQFSDAPAARPYASFPPDASNAARNTVYRDSVRNRSGTSVAFSQDGYVSDDQVPLRPPHPPTRKPELSWFLTLLLLITVTGTVAIVVDWLVEAMDELSTTISKEWIGLIVLPTISAVAECITAVKVSVKDELTLSVSVAVGSTIQTALFVIPFCVILGWITNKPLSLLMDPFQSMVLYIAVHTMGYVVADGKSNWLEGLILICLYFIIAVSFWFYLGSTLPTSFSTCTTAS
ncbi:Sodium/calcium exchanger protein-domain-containing protein [Panaeolus papilionaceus]|nr:Sodium/calcium exchanger protein-domain-containing protein [Panaeolus papilionaceus]